MLTENDLKELVAFKTGNEAVLSVYLNTEPANGNADVSKLRLRNMLKTINHPEDVNAVEHYINLEYKWLGRGVAVFSSAAHQFFKAFPLALAVNDMVHLGDRPSIKPLLDLFDNYGGYGVALVDKQGARFFNFHLGELREQGTIEGELVKHTKDAVTGQKIVQEETVERNMREEAEKAAHFFEETNVRRVVIGGTDDNVALFRSLLPKAWQSLVIGSFAANKAASQGEVLQHTQQIGLEYYLRKETELLKNLLARAVTGDGVVLGLEDSLKAVNAARVQTLVLQENLSLAGNRCDTCGHLTSTPLKVCANCGGMIYKYPDVIELAVSEVMRHGGDVQIVHGSEPLMQARGIGAFLRY